MVASKPATNFYNLCTESQLSSNSSFLACFNDIIFNTDTRAIIIGAVVGGVLALVILIVVVIVVYLRYKRRANGYVKISITFKQFIFLT